jgi:anti-sigma B factor antagonist
MSQPGISSIPPGPAQFVRIEQHHGVLTAQPIGPAIAEREATIIDAEIAEAMSQVGDGLAAVVLDLSRVTFISSMGLSMCINTHNRAKAVKAKALIFGLNDDLRGLFQMVRLDKFFLMPRTSDELAKSLGR